jgi:hypothetical protein
MNKDDKLISIFNQVEDPRSHINKLHNLIDKKIYLKKYESALFTFYVYYV